MPAPQTIYGIEKSSLKIKTSICSEDDYAAVSLADLPEGKKSRLLLTQPEEKNLLKNKERNLIQTFRKILD